MGTHLGLILTEKNKVPSNTAIAKIWIVVHNDISKVKDNILKH